MGIYEARAFLALCIALLLAGSAAGLWLLRRARPRPYTLWLLFALFAIEAVLGLLHELKYTVGVSPPLVYHFHMHSEFSPTPLLASAQLVMTGLAALLLGWLSRSSLRGERLLWSWLALYLLYFAFDEYFKLHESIRHWELLYILAALLPALAGLWVWRRAWRADGLVLALLALAAGVMLVSGIIVEKLVVAGRTLIGQLMVFEEMFEMVGVTLLLGALLVHAQRRLDSGAWRRLTRVIPLTGLAVIPLLAAYTWVLPAVELQLTATPLQVEWRGGDLVLRGLRVDGSPAQAGDTLSIWLYWEARQAFWENENLSLHAVSRPDLSRSFASAEERHIGQYESTGFIPGIVVRKQIALTLPDALPQPASLALMLRLWNGSHRDGSMRGIDIHRSEQQVAGTDQVIIGSIAVPGPAPVAPLAYGVNAQFGDSIALKGLALPDRVAAGETLVLSLDRMALQKPARELTQFLHLFALEDGSFAAGFDATPFGGRFPAPDWPVGQVLRDHWRVTVPPELTPGEYTLVHGMYDSQTQERLRAAMEGELLPDGLLPLGTLQVLPQGA